YRITNLSIELHALHPRPLPLADKGHLLPDFYSGATGPPGRFSEGFLLRRLHTMVFTHLPSNILLILTPLAPNLATAIALLLVPTALPQMDVPTGTSYGMAVVPPPERPAAASITAVPKTFAWAAGSMISGYLLTLSTFGWPLLIGGVIKGVYDILLLIKFQKV